MRQRVIAKIIWRNIAFLPISITDMSPEAPRPPNQPLQQRLADILLSTTAQYSRSMFSWAKLALTIGLETDVMYGHILECYRPCGRLRLLLGGNGGPALLEHRREGPRFSLQKLPLVAFAGTSGGLRWCGCGGRHRSNYPMRQHLSQNAKVQLIRILPSMRPSGELKGPNAIAYGAAEEGKLTSTFFYILVFFPLIRTIFISFSTYVHLNNIVGSFQTSQTFLYQ